MQKIFFGLFIFMISFQFCQAKDVSSWQKTVFTIIDFNKGYSATLPLIGKDKSSTKNIFDKNTSTAWVENKKGESIGRSIYITIPDNKKNIQIFNGNGASKKLYKKYGKIRNIGISLYLGINPDGFLGMPTAVFYLKKYSKVYKITLKDVCNFQNIVLPFSLSDINGIKTKMRKDFQDTTGGMTGDLFFILKLTIDSTKKGQKYSQAAISEIMFRDDVFIHSKCANSFNTIEDVYESDDQHSILVDADGEKGIPIITDKNSVFTVESNSKNNIWIIVEKAPAGAPQGRIETINIIVNTMLKKDMSPLFEKYLGRKLIFFDIFQREGKEYVDTEDGQPIELW